MRWIILFCFCLSACSRQYRAERLAWKADQWKKSILENPSASPTGLYEKTISLYQKLISLYPDTLPAAEAQFSMGELTMTQGQTGRAKEIFEQVTASYPQYPQVASQALFALGYLAEKENHWPKALALYQRLLKEYPETTLALQIPLHIARRYHSAGNAKEATKAYQEAVVYYQAISEKYQGTQAGVSSLNFIFQCYADNQQWPEALRVLKTIREQYPKTPEASEARFAQLKLQRALQRQKS